MPDIDHELEKATGVALAVLLQRRTPREIRNVAQRCGYLGIAPKSMLEECVLLDVLIAVASTDPDGKDEHAHDDALLEECWKRIGNHAALYWERQRRKR